MPKDQLDALMGEYGAFTQEIRNGGQYVGGEALQPTQTATTVRVRQGKISTTDGPFTETKELTITSRTQRGPISVDAWGVRRKRSPRTNARWA